MLRQYWKFAPKLHLNPCHWTFLELLPFKATVWRLKQRLRGGKKRGGASERGQAGNDLRQRTRTGCLCSGMPSFTIGWWESQWNWTPVRCDPEKPFAHQAEGISHKQITQILSLTVQWNPSGALFMYVTGCLRCPALPSLQIWTPLLLRQLSSRPDTCLSFRFPLQRTRAASELRLALEWDVCTDTLTFLQAP